MATRQNDKTELSKIVGAISKLAGTVVGTAVVTGKRVVKNVTPSGGASSEPGKKSAQAPAKRKKKAAPKKKTQGRKARKKKPARKAGTKGQKAKKKRKIAKKKGTSPARKGGISKEVEAVKEQEPQPEVTKVKLYGS
jgi:hypothetical protein